MTTVQVYEFPQFPFSTHFDYKMFDCCAIIQDEHWINIRYLLYSFAFILPFRLVLVWVCLYQFRLSFNARVNVKKTTPFMFNIPSQSLFQTILTLIENQKKERRWILNGLTHTNIHTANRIGCVWKVEKRE